MSYKACGSNIWEHDVAVKPSVNIVRPYPCGPNMDNNPLFDENHQRAERFSDTQLSSNSSAMEQFWFEANGQYPFVQKMSEYLV